MSYDSVEISVDDAQPYFLYQFDDGITQTRFTSDPENLMRLSLEFEACSISHGELEQNGTIEKSMVDFTFANSSQFARSLRPAAARVTTVTMWRGHHTDLSEELRVVWKGRIVGAKDVGDTIVLGAESVFTSLRRPGCRARYQRTCRHALYHTGCNLDKADFAVPALLTSLDGLTMTVPVAANETPGEYKAGMIEYNGVLGFIASHSGEDLVLLNEMPGLQDAFDAEGVLSVILYPGCDLSAHRCNYRFNNIENNGAFPFMSDDNPFDHSII